MQKIGDLIPGALKAPIYHNPKPSRIPQPAKLDDLIITHPKMQTAVNRARRWHKENKVLIADGKAPMSLVMAGPNGVGKTHIARAILWSYYYTDDDGQPVAPVGKFFMAGDVIELLESGNSVRELITPPIWHFANGEHVVTGCPLVVIDDVGSEQNVKYISANQQQKEIKSRYFKIINYCLNYQISLVITSSNECGTPEKLSKHLGERCWSRLLHMAPKSYILNMSHIPDWRKKSSGR